MEFYQIKKLLKNVVTEPKKVNNHPKFISQVKSLEMSVEEDQYNEDFLPGVHSPKSKDSPSKRHDRAFTLSWASKQDEKRKDYLLTNSVLNNESPKMTSPTTNSPVTKKNRSYVMHLSSHMDNEIYKVPLYEKEKDVFDIRQQNERILKQVISNKQAHQSEFNKIAQDNRFMQFRSSPLLAKSPKLIFQDPLNLSPVIKNRSSIVNNSLRLSTINKTIRDSEDLNNPDQLDIPSTSSLLVPIKLRTDRPASLLEGLEDIYQGDLKKKAKGRGRPKSLALDKLGAQSIPKKKKDGLNKNYKHYFHDDILMKKLEDPYAKSLPFEKPVVGSLRQDVVKDLQEIETKAQVLRNIKMIDESIAREVGVNGSLPQITENYDEDGEKVVSNQQKVKVKKNKANLNLWAKHMANSKAKVNVGSMSKNI